MCAVGTSMCIVQHLHFTNNFIKKKKNNKINHIDGLAKQNGSVPCFWACVGDSIGRGEVA